MSFGFSLGPGYSSSSSAPTPRSPDQTGDIMLLKGEIERLLMITEALWSFLKEQHGYSDEELIKKVAEIDLRDGRLDGRVAPEQTAPASCPQCHRPVGRKRATCLYCNAALVRDPFER